MERPAELSPKRALFIVPDVSVPPTKGYQVRCIELAAALSPRYASRVMTARGSLDPFGADASARPLWRIATLVSQLLKGRSLQTALFDGNDVANRVNQAVRDWSPHLVVILTERLPITSMNLRGDRLVIDIVDSLNVHMTERAARARFPMRMLWLWEARGFRRSATTLQEHAAAIIVADESALMDYPRAVVIRNAARRSTRPRPAPSIDAIFTGNLAYWPNVRAALEICDKIAPRIHAAVPGARVVIAGRDPVASVREAARLSSVELIANAADIDALLRISRLALAPVAWTPGANLKVMEALAAGTPVLAYRAAAARLPPSTTGVSVCDDAEAMASTAIDFLLRRQPGAVVNRDQHTWWARGQELERILNRIVPD